MSHIVQIKTEVRDTVALSNACSALKLSPPRIGEHKLFSGQVSGLGVQLDGWKYPVVFQPASGEVKYDNYNGRWGDRAQLDSLLRQYAVEKVRLEARRKGHTVTSTELSDGRIKLTVNVGGAA